MREQLHKKILPILSSLILSGCAASGAPATTIRVSMTDFAFLPSTVAVPAGEEIALTVTNNGAVAHSFAIMKLGHEISSQGHFGATDRANVLWGLEPVSPGATSLSTFTAPAESGEYQIVCDIAGHFEAGMVGRLIVVATP